ncbi:TerD family protein [Streptomyces chrestomyceticus]|uniref:TerD family protein n=1 Tax=Streptomyces chrestomyceticus TaxID=68185 RepID=A0ABU7WZL2_9ACTN
MTVNLTKGQQVSLTKTDGRPLTLIRMGLGWQATPRQGFLARFMPPRDIDLDASAVLFSGAHFIDVVYFDHLLSDDGAVEHSGDDRTGGTGAGGDDESIRVNLLRVSPHVDQIVFVVNSFSGETFEAIENAHCRLVDDATGQELARYTLAADGPHTAQIMAKVARRGDMWHLVAIGQAENGRTFEDLLPAVARHV